MRALAFAFGLCVAIVCAVGILAPSRLVWVAQHFGTPIAFYVVATVRVAFGLVLVSVASPPARQRRSASWATSW